MGEAAIFPSLSSKSKVGRWLALDAGLTEAGQDPYEVVSAFRSKERTQMIGSIRDFIEEAQKRAKLKNTPSRERLKWMNLAGKLIWYKDQILRSMTHEAMEKEILDLKKIVNSRNKFPPSSSPPNTPRRIIRGPGKSIQAAMSRKPTPAISTPSRR